MVQISVLELGALPPLKPYFILLKKLPSLKLYATVTGLVYEEQLDNITKHELKKSAWVESRSSPDLTRWGIQL